MAETDASTIQDTVVEIVASALRIKPETITPDKHLQEDLGADSLDAITITEKLEDRYAIEISEQDMQNFVTIGAIVEGLEKLLAGQGAP